jgi:hypothetical protein
MLKVYADIGNHLRQPPGSREMSLRRHHKLVVRYGMIRFMFVPKVIHKVVFKKYEIRKNQPTDRTALL